MKQNDRRNDRGLALAATVWMVLVLALAAATILSANRSRVQVQRNAADMLISGEAARGAVNIAIHQLSVEAGRRILAIDGRQQKLRIGGVDVVVAIEDERGKLSLPHSPRSQVASLMREIGRHHGRDAFDANHLADRLIAEAKAPSSQAASIPELCDRLDLDRPLCADLERHATLLGFGPGLNPLTASPEAMRAVGVDERTVSEILAARVLGARRPSAGNSETWLRGTEGPAYTIRATAMIDGGLSRSMTAVAVSQGVGFGSEVRRVAILALQ